MDKVFDGLYVGDSNDGQNLSKIRENNITAVLNVGATNTASKTKDEARYFHIPLKDGIGNSDTRLERVIKLAEELHEEALEEDESLLIHCDMGASRSVSIAAALMSLRNQDVVPENVERIGAVRTIANPVEELVSQVNRITREIYTNQR